MPTIRRATLEDLNAITEIYNEAILHTIATFDIEPKTIEEQMPWFVNHDSKHPILVAEQDGLVAGWASLSKWSDRCAYSGTAEISLYVKKECRRKGIGRNLLEEIIKEGQKNCLHTVIARITEGNELSVNLFKQEKFEIVGVMKEVGRKFGKLLDVFMMQRIFEN
jgi:L-amino acid N-acyltransferase YncA